MKQILLLLLTCTLSLSLSAQFSLEVDPELYQVNLSEDLTDNWTEPIIHGFAVNTSQETLMLRWVLEITGTDCPAEWEYRVCDNTQCYSTDVSSNVDPDLPLNVPVELAPGDTTIIEFHILPRMVAGCCTAKIHFTPADDFNNVINSACYEYCIEGLVNVTEEEKEALRVYPNPTTDYIMLTENDVVDRLVVYNLIGKPVRTFQAQNGQQYDLAGLPNGIYLVSLLDNENGIIKTMRISKHTLRP